MASWQAHVLDALLRVTIKRQLKNNTDIASVRATLGGGGMPAPKGVSFRAGIVGDVPGEWASATAEGAPTLLYLHGGGYFACSPQTHRPVTWWFAKAGFSVFAPDYRLAPEYPFPAAVEDAEAAYLGLLGAGHAAQNLVVAGDSAGGGLAVALLVKLRDGGHPLPAGGALFSPWTDLAVTGDSVRENVRKDAMFWAPGISVGAAFYLDGADPRTPLASPLYADLHGLPPLLIQAGERELLRDDSTRMAARTGAALRIWPVVPHVWQIMHRFVPEGRESLMLAADFLKEKVKEGQGALPPAPPLGTGPQTPFICSEAVAASVR